MFSYLTTIRFLRVILLLFLFPVYSGADTLWLKSGEKIVTESVWEENGQIRYKLYGATVGVSKDRVQKIVRVSDAGHDNRFKFDVWPFGITVRQAIGIAERNDIPLHRAGIISANKNFAPHVKKYAQTATEFYYNTNLLGSFAKVRLSFTPLSKKLHTVSIRWQTSNARKSALRREVESMICRKYGRRSHHERQIIFDITEWNVSDGNRIQLRVSSGSIDLNYIEGRYRALSIRESDRIKSQHMSEARGRDQRKF